jgi:hypothetical protein
MNADDSLGVLKSTPTSSLFSIDSTTLDDDEQSAFAETPQTAPSKAISLAGERETRLLLSLQAVDIQQVDSDKAHLVLGFRQLVIASLVKFREWHVTDAPFQAPPDPLQEKGTCYEIQMFAYQTQQAVQLTLMLKELDTGFYIWSDGFELSLDNWFDSQRRVISNRCHQRAPIGGTSPSFFRGARYLSRSLRQMVALPNACPHIRSAAVGSSN